MCICTLMCEKNVQADETPLGQKALEREDHVLGAERWLMCSEGKLHFITFVELVELQSLHLQRGEACNPGASACCPPVTATWRGRDRKQPWAQARCGAQGRSRIRRRARPLSPKILHSWSKRLSQQKFHPTKGEGSKYIYACGLGCGWRRNAKSPFILHVFLLTFVWVGLGFNSPCLQNVKEPSG